MPQEQLLLLAQDVDRLLAAGGKTAPGDPNLLRRSLALRDLSRHVPALGPIADAVDQVANAPQDDATPALLHLLLLIQQVRVTLSGAGVPGEAEALKPSGPWQPAGAFDLYPLMKALVSANGNRSALLKEALDAKHVRDVRLMGPLLDILERSTGDLATLVAEKVLPEVGAGIAPEVEAGLDYQGGVNDARRLDTLVRLDPIRGARHCRKILAGGSIPMQAQALECLARVKPTEAQQHALALLQQPRQKAPLKQAAYNSLGDLATDEAMELLLGALPRARYARRSLVNAMHRMPHPAITERMLAALPEPLTEVRKLWKERSGLLKKRKSPKVREEIDANYKKIEKERAKLRDPMQVLVGRPEREAIATVLDLIDDRCMTVKQMAREALHWFGPQSKAALPDLLALLKGKSAEMRSQAASLIGRLGEHAAPSAIKPLIARLRDKNSNVRREVIETLGEIGPLAAAAVPSLLKEFTRRGSRHTVVTITALGRMGAAAKPAIPYLKEIASKGKSWWERHQAERVLKELERA